MEQTMLIAVLIAALVGLFLFDTVRLRRMQVQRDAAKEEVAEVKTEFLSRISHEIKTPMNVIVGATALGLEETEHPERMEECLNRIRGASEFLMGLLNDLVDMSKIENGKFQHLKECEGLNPQVIDMIDTLYEKRLRECCDELLCIAMTMYRIFNMQERPLQRPEYKRRTEMAWRAVNKARKDKLIELSESKKSLKESPADNIPLAVKVKEHFDSSGMRGQEEAKKIVAMSVHKFVISEGKDRNPILLEGPTGSGKTFMFQLLEEMPELKDLCFFNYCASDMTPNGFSGDDISNVFSKYERMARQKMKKGENGLQMPLGIIFLDEMDKIIGMSNTDSNGEDCNAIVTAQLLTAIAGTQNYGSVDTSKILFIMAGAFEELENSRKKKREEHGIGFAVNASAKENSMTGYDLREELEEIGVSKQFLGRVPYIVHMDRLSRAQLRQILVDKEHGVFGKKQKWLKRNGKTLTYDEDLVEEILDRMEEHDMGARGAAAMLETLIGTAEYDMFANGYKNLHLHKGMFFREEPVFDEQKGKSRDK